MDIYEILSYCYNISNMKKEKDQYIITETQQEYLKIYHEYFVLRWSWNDICKYHNCSRNRISDAIHWVIDNKIKIKSEHLIKGAIDAITIRLNKNYSLYEQEINRKRGRDNMFIIAINREIREDEKTINTLNQIIDNTDNDKSNLSSSQVLGLISAAMNKE